MLVLGIETSCDETAAAVVADGRRVLSNRIASQVPIHQRYGGVVPEIASRAHLEQIVAIVEGSLADACIDIAQVDAIAVTRGPGLAGCLLVGVEYAKALSAARGIPLVAVQHVAGHLYSPFVGREKDAWGTPVEEPADHAPYIGMAVSGGHSSMVLARGALAFEPLGETLDDAVGEAYDKIAKLMGLGYPGGPLVDRLAADGDPNAFAFPRPLVKPDREGYDFSFSGLKTSVAREVEKMGGAAALAGKDELLRNLCASFQAAAVDVLVSRAKKALALLPRPGRLAVVGGVACNRGLRTELARRLPSASVALPEPEFCTDNAAMIAGAGYEILRRGLRTGLDLNATPRLTLCAPAVSWQGPVAAG